MMSNFDFFSVIVQSIISQQHRCTHKVDTAEAANSLFSVFNGMTFISHMGVVLFHHGCRADATFDCTMMLNVISKLVPGLTII